MRTFSLLPALLGLVAVVGCGDSERAPAPMSFAGAGGAIPDAGDASVPDTSGGGAGGDEDAALDSADDHRDVNFGYDSYRPDSMEACVVTTQEAEHIALDAFIMLDRSGSMGTDCDVGEAAPSKWCKTINALDGFIDVLPTGTRIALEYFPSDGECDGSGYDVPAVPLVQLPIGAPALIDSLNSERPSGGTPTEAGLRGITSFTSAILDPARVTVGILITDGVPTTCSRDIAELSQIVSDHLGATGVNIFMVGMDGANFDQLELIAVGGGSPTHDAFCGINPPCHHYDVGDGDPLGFVQVLREIRQVAVECRYQMPTPTTGIIDPDEVRFDYTPSGSSSTRVLERVLDESDCGSGDWYYDDNGAPTTIVLCPSTCEMIGNDINPLLELYLGCLGS